MILCGNLLIAIRIGFRILGVIQRSFLGPYALLIRPDGCIAWASDNSSDGSDVIQALSKWRIVSPNSNT
ncbi:aromatic-ring hydroxylase C-terminal domain-containing protein [Gluconobacter sphaericus]|uniref:aromatic-ring hydroxylase C-terminal domain-containing protein n=1 Tax=Gluconobacter sphaericus TaxID=574987 RepID=UPI0031FE84A0